jgi:isopentenyl-diphosphate Delta-isomerase
MELDQGQAWREIVSRPGSGDDDPIILVNDDDVEIGTAGKLDAHKRGLKHRAISVLVRNSSGELLLQQRHPGKYHSGLLWANACCSHPMPGESTIDAAHRRLGEEMGISCTLMPLFKFDYRAAVSEDLIENELVHAFGGTHDGEIAPDPLEVSQWKWIRFDDLANELRSHPEDYAIWFRKYVAAHGGLILGWLSSR